MEQPKSVLYQIADNIWINGPSNDREITPEIVRQHIAAENIASDAWLIWGYGFSLISVAIMALVAIYFAVVYSANIYILVGLGVVLFLISSAMALRSGMMRDHAHFRIGFNYINTQGVRGNHGEIHYIVTPRLDLGANDGSVSQSDHYMIELATRGNTLNASTGKNASDRLLGVPLEDV